MKHRYEEPNQSQGMIKTIIRAMNQKATTISLTTHNIEEANMLCDIRLSLKVMRIISVQLVSAVINRYIFRQSPAEITEMR